MANTQPRVNGKFAKGGVVDMVSKGIEAVAKAAGTSGGKAITAADKSLAPHSSKPSLGDARIESALEKSGDKYAKGGVVKHSSKPSLGASALDNGTYAKGGKVNRFAMGSKSALAATALAAPSNAGADTPPAAAAAPAPAAQVFPPAAVAPAAKFRGTPMKRAGATPSLPYPKRR